MANRQGAAYVRRPAVAGYFYPGTTRELEASLQRLVPDIPSKKQVLAVMSPHAGYMYSGGLAGKLYASISIPPTVVLLGVNHRGVGRPYAIDDRDGWETPLGVIPLQRDLCNRIRGCCPDLAVSHAAFDAEHSLEVQVPFLQHLAASTSLIPIAIGAHDPEIFRELGKGIAEAIRNWGKETLIIASSDMSHYESAESAKKKDEKALKAIHSLDPDLMLREIARYDISMCGYAPTAIMLHAAKALGATKAHSVGYCNSGDATGDYSSVVAYAAVTVQ